MRSEVKYDEFLNDETCRPRACGGEPFPVNFREAWTLSCPCRDGMSMYVAGKDGPPSKIHVSSRFCFLCLLVLRKILIYALTLVISFTQDCTGCSSSSEAIAEICTVAWTVPGFFRQDLSTCILRVQVVETSTLDD